ncbi:MAG: 30S ribosomal protein S16 [Deltaproteobacteria bacterium]|nr:30S ribosomal protein S16 [Deltaproteobacteria bacterium]
MALTIRLTRKGAKKNAFYRIVVADSRFPRDGRVVEQVGFYNPHKDDKKIELYEDKLRHWLDKGARPSVTVKSLLKAHGDFGV